MARVLISTGGSVGHLAPAVAVWRAVLQKAPESEVRFLCSDRKEDVEYLVLEGITGIAVPRVRRGVGMISSLWQGYRIARDIITDFQPDVAFCKGGSVSVAPAWAARRAGIPIVLHESDAVMGSANRLVARWAVAVCTGFTLENPAYTVTGNPVRPDMLTGSRAEGLRLTGLSGEKPILLILGGSQGAQAINEAVAACLPMLLPLVDIVHLTGIGKTGALPQPGYCPLPFAGKELAHLYAIAGLALSRAGAGSIAELAAVGIPVLLVPIRGLAHDHQARNAQRAAASGGCAILEQAVLRERLVDEVTAWLRSSDTLAQKSQNMRTLWVPDAADRIAAVLLGVAGSR